MGFGFRKSVKIAPGVRLNFSTRGIGASVGVKGLRYSVNSRGQRRTTVSVPGTGLYYTSTSSGARSRYRTPAYQRQSELVRRQREIEKLAQLEQNRLEVELFENRLEMIKSIHKECDDPVDWVDVRDTPPPFVKGNPGPMEQQALTKLQTYKPGFFAKMFHQDEKQMGKLQANVVEAKKADEEAFQAWSTMVVTAGKVLAGDLDAYIEVIQEFAPLDDLSEFGSGFEFSFNEPGWMQVEFDVHSRSVVPSEVKSLTSTGKLSVKSMPVTRYYDLQQDYVCSCVLRIARDMFALLPLHTIIVHAVDTQLNTATGHEEKVVILSVKIDKTTLNRLNFDSIDCSDSMVNFEHKMNFRKTKGFAPVEKVQM